MQLSKNFSLAEACVTSTNIPNEPHPEHMIALHIAAFGMEQVRYLLGNVAIRALSWYRNRKVNNAVGGVSNSDHSLGYAIDFKPSNMSAYKAACIIRDSDLQFDQLILERNNTLIHLSFNPRLRRQVLRQPGGPGTPFISDLD